MDGNVIFSRVEDNTELQAAVENEELTADNWRAFLPSADVLTTSSGGEVSLLLANAEQYTPASQ